MATPGRTEDPAVERPSIADVLEREPYRFGFFQAVRLLERLMPDREPVGRFVHPAAEVARFGANPSVAFPASEIQSLTHEPGQAPQLRVNFMGLTGPLGVLPLVYSELVLERLRARDTTLRDFLDIFNHRMISLFYQAWEKYRFPIAYERGERDRFSQHLLDLIGLGTPGLQDRQEVPDDSLLFYSGLLAMRARSAAALEQILSDYFGVEARVEQFVGAWYPMDRDAQCCLGESGDYSGQLGFGAVVGDEVWDQQSRIRIQLGPLTFVQYQDFLPAGDAQRRLRAITRFFAGAEFDIEVQLILKRDEVPRCEVGAEDWPGPQLGWTSWIKSAPFARDPADAILQI